MYAVIETGGKQYRVSPGDVIEVEKIQADEGTEVTFDQVLLVGTEGETRLGRPWVEGARVVARVVQHGRAPKVLVFKIKRRKNYRRKHGHRQAFTRLSIQDIRVG